MSLTLTEYPVTAFGRRCFPGFEPIEVKFKREDIDIDAIASGAGSKVEITVTGDITGDLAVGDFIYIYSEGTGYTYDTRAEVTAISYSSPDTTILTDLDYIVSTSDGYMNYLQNYAVEMKLVDPDNDDIDMLGYSLFDDGTPSGEIVINTAVITDSLEIRYRMSSTQCTCSRVKYNVKYRETYADSSESFTTISNPIISIFATEDFTENLFLYRPQIGKVYTGYPIGVSLVHSDEEQPGKIVRTYVEFLDINKTPVSGLINLHDFNIGDYGSLYTVSGDYTDDIPTDAMYLRVYAYLDGIAEYDKNEYDNDEYSV